MQIRALLDPQRRLFSSVISQVRAEGYVYAR